MIRFAQFLVEGGNVKVGEHQAGPIDVKKHKRENVQADVHAALTSIGDSFQKAHKADLFGPKHQALTTGSAYSGSTKALFDKNISHEEFTKHKPSVGDVDVKIPGEHIDNLKTHLQPGQKHGKYTVVGSKRSGTELHALMKHENGSVHQVDFEKSEYKDGHPHPFEQFAHSADWGDIKQGFKGVHHKILLNAVGRDKHKFGISKGLMSRTDDKAEPIRDTHKITHTLFGKDADEKQLHSFSGLVGLIKKHVPKEHHAAISDKFVDSLKTVKADHTAAIKHIKQHLGGSIKEAKDSENHVSVIPLTGFEPHSHMGHAADLGSALKKLPGKKHIGISAKASAFSPEERTNILKKQWNAPDIQSHVSSSAGEIVANAHHEMPAGKKHLHLLGGHDRKPFLERLKGSLEAGKIPEMKGKKFDSITLHYPEDAERSHGMSGTKMRQAAADNDLDTYHKHLGPMFSKKEASAHMSKIQQAIKSGSIPLKRKK
jgi:hypothetical protein